MHKRYETARELIDCLVDYHHRAATLSETGMDMEQEARVQLVFNYLYDHHLQMQDALATVDDGDEDSGVGHTLNTPVEFELRESEAPEAFLEGLTWGENMSFDAVTRLAKEMADYAIGLIDDICAYADDPDVQDIFEKLLEMEQEELKLLIRGVNSLRNP